MLGTHLRLACVLAAGAALAHADPPRRFPYEPALRGRPAPADAGGLPLDSPRGASPLELAALARAGITATAGEGPLLATTIEIARADGVALISADLAAEVAWLEMGALWRRIETDVLGPELDALALGMRDALGESGAGDPALEPARALAATYVELLLAFGPAHRAPRDPRAIAALATFARGEPLVDLLDRPLAPPADALDLAGALLGRPDRPAGEVEPDDPRWLAALTLTRSIFARPELERRWERMTALVAGAVGGHPAGDPRLVARRLMARAARPLLGPDGVSRSILSELERAGVSPAIALLGPRRAVDHDWLARAAFPYAGTPAVPRTDPGGLELAAALGSPLALAELIKMEPRWPGLRGAILALAVERLPLPGADPRAEGCPSTAHRAIDSAYAGGLDVAAAMLRAGPPTAEYSREAWQARSAAFVVGTWLRMRAPPDAPRALAAPDGTAIFRAEPVPGVFARTAALVRAVRADWTAALEPGPLVDEIERILAPLATDLDRLAEQAARPAADADPSASALARMVATWCARPIHPAPGAGSWVVLARATDPRGRERVVRARLDGALTASFVLALGARRTVVRGAIHAHTECALDADAPDSPTSTMPEDGLPLWIARHLVPANGRSR